MSVTAHCNKTKSDKVTVHTLWLSLLKIGSGLTQRWKHFRRPPVVVISHYGQKTDRPQVHVSVASLNGIQGVYTFDATPQGEASASMYGKGLARIMQRKLVDRRPPHIRAER